MHPEHIHVWSGWGPSLEHASGTRTTTAYYAANQIRYSLAAAGRATYTFDTTGNQQIVLNPDAIRATTTWSYGNQATFYRLADGSRVTMTYSSDLRRVQKDA